MKEYHLFHSEPENPLKVSQEMCNRVSNGLKNKLGKYYSYVLPPHDSMTDVYLYKLNYLDTALSVLRECKGYDKHIAEYQNNLNSTFFVTVVADVLAAHGLTIELEPEILNTESKKPDLFAYQMPDGLGVYFECKQPKEDTHQFIKEQNLIFDGIEDVISEKYSLALFYDKELSSEEITRLRSLIDNSLTKGGEIFEERVIVDSKELGVKLVVSGISYNIEKSGIIEMEGIPNFSNDKGYSNVNGINRYGKNIVFYKSVSKSALGNQLKASTKKVPEGTPYVVCIDISGPRFDVTRSSEKITNHFNRGDFSNFTGVLLVTHGVINEGKYHAALHYLENENSNSPLPFLKNFFTKTMTVDIEMRAQTER